MSDSERREHRMKLRDKGYLAKVIAADAAVWALTILVIRHHHYDVSGLQAIADGGAAAATLNVVISAVNVSHLRTGKQ